MPAPTPPAILHAPELALVLTPVSRGTWAENYVHSRSSPASCARSARRTRSPLARGSSSLAHASNLGTCVERPCGIRRERPAYTAFHMPHKQRVVPRLVQMPERRVKAPPGGAPCRNA